MIYKTSEIAVDIDLVEESDDGDPSRYPIHDLKSGAGAAKVANIKKVADRLRLLQQVELPSNLFSGIPLRFLGQYQQQAAVESISHLQRHVNKPQTHTLLASFCWVRQRKITDQLVDLFIRVLKDITLRANRVEKEILFDCIRVGGKQQILYRLVQAMWDHPDGIISKVLYPLVGKDRLHSLVEEAKNKGTYRQSVQSRISGSYTYHYRRILPPLLDVLTIHSNNEQYQPLVDALDVVATYLEEDDAFYPANLEVPMDDVIQKQWQSWNYQQDRRGRQRIRRVRYELCVLQSLRDKLRCKEIWVEGADRYRNPDDDVPGDFSDKREELYESLSLPLNASKFVTNIKTQLEAALKCSIPLAFQPTCGILAKSNGWIRVSPLKKQPTASNLDSLKNHIRRRWSMTICWTSSRRSIFAWVSPIIFRA